MENMGSITDASIEVARRLPKSDRRSRIPPEPLQTPRPLKRPSNSAPEMQLQDTNCPFGSLLGASSALEVELAPLDSGQAAKSFRPGSCLQSNNEHQLRASTHFATSS